MTYSKIHTSILTLILATLFFSGCKRHELKLVLNTNQDNLQTICNDFLKQKNIRNICITAYYDKGTCDVVNSWCLRFKKWETWNEQKQTTIYLNTLDEVLTYERIDKVKYDFFVNALKKYNLKSIGKVYNCSTCVDLEYDLDGLRYSQDNTYRLKQDYEYLKVKQLNPNWAFYMRDWN